MKSIFAALLLVSVLAHAGPILINPGFETGTLAPWTVDSSFGSGSPWAITNTNCNSGSFCATSTGDFGLEQTFGPISTLLITDVSFFVMHPDPTITGIAYDFFYQGGGDDEFLVVTTDASWDFFDVTSNLRPDDTLVGFEIFGDSGGITMADDLNILTADTSSVPEPSSFGLLLLSLGVLAAGTRRRLGPR